MDEMPISVEDARVIALEEGLKAAISLDSLHLDILNNSVEWICHLTGLSKSDVRRRLANKRGKQVQRKVATINAARSVLRSE
jgi:hypothetical protein